MPLSKTSVDHVKKILDRSPFGVSPERLRNIINATGKRMSTAKIVEILEHLVAIGKARRVGKTELRLYMAKSASEGLPQREFVPLKNAFAGPPILWEAARR